MTHRRRTWISEAIIIIALMLLPLLFWWRLWAPDPADRATIAGGDLSGQYYPLQMFAARELADGRLPVWDPYINAGQPGLADIQTGFFYPLNLLPNLVLALLGLPFTLGTLHVQIVLHYSLASLFTYLFVRHLARRAGTRIMAARFAGAIAALSFTYAGYLTSFPVQQLTILETAIWLPLILLSLDRAFHRSHRLPQLILAGMALACALLAGHPQTAMYVVYTMVAYGLFLVWSTRSAEEKEGIGYWLLGIGHGVLLPLVVGVALASIQLVPTLGFISRSTRAGLDYGTVAWGFPLHELTHLLYPGYFGGSPQYVGILPPILAVAALFVTRARREVTFWIITAAIALLLAFGGHTFLYNAAYLLAPGFGAVRNQERIIFLFGFAVSILAGYGSLTLVQPLPRLERRGFCHLARGVAWVFVVFLALTALFYFGYVQGLQQDVEVNLFEGILRHHVLLLLCLGGSAALLAQRASGRVRRAWLMALGLGLVWLNLFTVNWQFNLAAPQSGGAFPETGLVRFLQEQPGTFRISSAGLLPGGASAGIVYEVEDITGNTPLQLESFQQFIDQVGSWRQWQLLNVHFVLDRREVDGVGLERVYEEGEIKAYRVSDPLPRAWVVYSTVSADDELAIDLLNADEFDPRTVAVLPPGHGDVALPGTGEPGSNAQIVYAESGRLVLDVQANSGGMLVVSQPFYQGWQARIGPVVEDQSLAPGGNEWVAGEKVEIVRADLLLQGVPVDAGSHRVELRFRPSPLPAIISLAALAACLAGLTLRSRKAT